MKTTSILMVDDEQTFLNSMVRKLRTQGYTNFTPISDSSKVYELLKVKNFDAAFLDITMPQPDGLELLEIKKS